MRLLVHLSDIHFGSVDPSLVEPLIETIRRLDPHLVAVSGDLTQRARSYQFQQAREFLDALPKPQIVVPGNHDVPLYNLFSRFFVRLRKYKRYITSDLDPFYQDEEIAVAGLNTARSLTFKSGRVNESQIQRAIERFGPLSEETTKVIVTHHPFDLPEGHRQGDLVGRSQMAMRALAKCGADLFLAGHLHISHVGHTAKRYNIKGHSALVVQAGTATSNRVRGEKNSFNVIRVEHPELTVERLEWQAESREFVTKSVERFRHTTEGWVRKEEPSTDNTDSTD